MYPALSASPSVGDGGAGPLEGEHALRPRLAGELVGFPAHLSRALGRYADRGAVKPIAGGVTKRELMRIVKKRTVHPFEITNASETSALMTRLCIRLGCSLIAS